MDWQLKESRWLQTKAWSIGEESGKVVADKWLHHLRFTLTEALAATSTPSKQSQPNAPSNSHVILFTRPLFHSCQITSKSYRCHYHRPAHVIVVVNKEAVLADTTSPPKLLRLANIPSLSLYNSRLQHVESQLFSPSNQIPLLPIRQRLGVLVNHHRHAAEAQGRRRLWLSPVQARGVRCEHSREHGQ